MSIHKKDITVVNIYVTNIRKVKYIKEILIDLKAMIDYNTMLVGDVDTPHSKMNRSSKQIINKKTLDSIYIWGEVDPIDM